ncbi:hypothetical protein [Salinisphaera sp. S4-8]|uniref:hypothetical protein n=1 Tax=Salinisphaera sp. S4-8 TaxID=633357 RepID=UPI00333E5B5E
MLTSNFPNWQGFRRDLEEYFSEVVSRVVCVDNNTDLKVEISRQTYDWLFVECDRAESYRFYAPHKRTGLLVFEEGLGTYNGRPLPPHRRLRWLKWRLMKARYGSGMFFGDGRSTDLIAVNFKELYLSMNKVCPARVVENRVFYKEIVRCERLVHYKPPELFRGQDLLLVLVARRSDTSRWSGYAKNFQYDNLLVKGHPHDEESKFDRRSVSRYFPRWAPAELVIKSLSDVAAKLTVIHGGSSASLYCRHLENVEFVGFELSPHYIEVMKKAKFSEAIFEKYVEDEVRSSSR